jgi:inorganic pyrophosphatase
MTSGVEITATYGRDHAGKVVAAAIQDYEDVFGPSHRAWEKLEERCAAEDARKTTRLE